MVTKEDTFTLYFNFQKTTIPEESRCYNLVCTTEYTVGFELFAPNNKIKTQYCFEEKKEVEKEEILKCNPNALTKIVDDKCVCSYPYKGDLCEECEKNFLKKSYHGHTECVLDEESCSEAT